MNWIKRRLSFANIVAAMALFAALGGVAYAAGGITGTEIKNHSITGKDIQKGSVPLTALKKLPEGTPGPKGATGAPGAPGAPGSALAFAHVNADGTLDAANSKNISASKVTNSPNYYCVSAAVPARSITATPADTIVARTVMVGFGDPFTSCPDGAAVVQTFDGTGKAAASAFYIVFN